MRKGIKPKFVTCYHKGSNKPAYLSYDLSIVAALWSWFRVYRNLFRWLLIIRCSLEDFDLWFCFRILDNCILWFMILFQYSRRLCYVIVVLDDFVWCSTIVVPIFMVSLFVFHGCGLANVCSFDLFGYYSFFTIYLIVVRERENLFVTRATRIWIYFII